MNAHANQDAPSAAKDPRIFPWAALICLALVGSAAASPGGAERFLAPAPGLTGATPSPRSADRPFRVLLYGDSHSAQGTFAHTLRDLLAGGGGSAPGFVAPGHPGRWDARVQTRGRWSAQSWLRRAATGPFGPLGVAYLSSDPGARLTLELATPATASTRVSAFYQADPDHPPFTLEAGGQALARVEPQAAPPPDRLGRVEVWLAAGATSLTLRLACDRSCREDHPLRFFGFRIDDDRARVVWDNLAVGGTTLNAPLFRGDEALWGYVRERDPDLLLLWYGTNSALDERYSPESYAQRWRALLRRLRAAAPRAACVLLTPPDFARPPPTCKLSRRARRRGACRRGSRCAPTTVPAILEIARIERAIAAEAGCASFDVLAWMGGPGSMQAWACAPTPLARRDLVHLNEAGYERLARDLYQALRSTHPAIGPARRRAPGPRGPGRPAHRRPGGAPRDRGR